MARRDPRWDDPRSPSRDSLRRALFAVIAIATAFGLGWQAGVASSVPPPPVCPPIAAPVCPEIASPEALAAAPPAPRVAPRRGSRPPRRSSLPPLGDEREDALRTPLLEWFQQRAPSLRTCLGESAARRALRVRVGLAESGRIERAEVVPTSGELTPEQARCLRDGIESWTLPSALAAEVAPSGPESLIFTLAL